MTVFTLNGTPVDSHDAQFFKAMGARIANARKAQNLTQQQLADQLGIAQQTFAHYEVGDRCFPASTLPKLAEILGLTVDELLGHDVKPKGKRGPAPKLQKQFERINQLPKATQQVLMKMLDGVLAQASH
jgi:transcriptional regulator with XRE-family HTH domain